MGTKQSSLVIVITEEGTVVIEDNKIIETYPLSTSPYEVLLMYQNTEAKVELRAMPERYSEAV